MKIDSSATDTDTVTSNTTDGVDTEKSTSNAKADAKEKALDDLVEVVTARLHWKSNTRKLKQWREMQVCVCVWGVYGVYMCGVGGVCILYIYSIY